MGELAETGGYPKSFVILYQGQIAGTIGFNNLNKINRIGIIGYWLGEKFQRKGIMTKALKAGLWWHFVMFGGKNIMKKIIPLFNFNFPSNRLMENVTPYDFM